MFGRATIRLGNGPHSSLENVMNYNNSKLSLVFTARAMLVRS